MIKEFSKKLWRFYVLNLQKLARLWYTFKIREQAATVGDGLIVNGSSSVNPNTVLGDNVNFNGLEVRESGSLKIGDNFHSGPGVRILTENHNYDDGKKIPYDDTFIEKPVHIEDNVWLGVDVVITPGVRIGEGAIVQAGSTVVKDVPKGAIVGGHPAEKFGERDMDHYNSLKKSGKFH